MQKFQDVPPKCFASEPDVCATPASLNNTIHLRTRATSASVSLLPSFIVEFLIET